MIRPNYSLVAFPYLCTAADFWLSLQSHKSRFPNPALSRWCEHDLVAGSRLLKRTCRVEGLTLQRSTGAHPVWFRFGRPSIDVSLERSCRTHGFGWGG